MLKRIKNYFFPEVDSDVSELMDKSCVKTLENISLIVAIFESFTLAFFVLTRKSFGHDEWLSVYSVLFCIITCAVGFYATKLMLSKSVMKHSHVVLLNASYFILMSLWAMWTSHRRYVNDEQILTFYAVEVMLVCFVIFKPWLSTILIMGSYLVLYAILYRADGGTGVNPINYFVLSLVCTIGMGIRYHELLKTTEATLKLQKTKDTEIQDKVNILNAIADIYDRVNLIDFEEGTETSIRDENQIKQRLDLENDTHTRMSTSMRKRIMPDQLAGFITFTDISTVRERLKGKRLISEDFIDVVDGWFRAQYIPVEVDESGVPTQIVFTTRNVDEERQREEHLVRIAMTDELTRLFNRRSFEEDLEASAQGGIDKDFVILSADVNGLKKVNDTKGHAGGDELIKGAAECLLLGIASKGKVYRTGGDEFVAILHTNDPESVVKDIEGYIEKWHGEYSEKLSISMGYAAHADDESMSIEDLEKKADDEMYKSKARYYEKNGIDRRASGRTNRMN